MRLKKLHLFNFKNYEKGEYVFQPGINCILGNNGVGKTNLLDAIYFACLTKSAFQSSDHALVRDGEKDASVKAIFEGELNEQTVHCIFGTDRKKEIRCNDETYIRYSDHIGRFNTIIIDPHDVDYVRMGSDLRRKLVDGLMSQSDHEYLEALLEYNRLLRQRNAVLKKSKENRYVDETLLDTYDEKLLGLAPKIATSRDRFIEQVHQGFQDLYELLTDGRETVAIEYRTEIGEEFPDSFLASRRADLEAGRTLLGIHRDDYDMLIDGKPLKQYGSQGQQKSFMLALKLTMVLQLGGDPILLLDDIFDRLDAGRVANLLKWVDSSGLQVILTDARPDRVEGLLHENGIESHNLYI